MTSCATFAPRRSNRRPGAAGDRARYFRLRPQGGVLQPQAVRTAARSRVYRAAAARPVAVGQARHPDRRTVGRHEAAGHDRQGAQPRARRAVPRRADRRRRRQPAPRHVGAGAPAARRGRHRHPDHPLHRGGRGDGGPGRRHQRRPDRAGRREGGADAQTRQAPPDARAAGAAAGAAQGARRLAARTRGRRPAPVLPLRRLGRRHRRADASASARARSASISRISTPARRRSRTFSSIWWDGRRERFGGDQFRRRLGDLPLRAAADAAHDLAERGDAGDHHRALFRRVRRGDRLAHQRSRRRELWRVHRAGPHHAVASDAEHLQRLDRHLLSQIHRHDLRAPVGADVVDRGGLRLCRRGGDQVGRHRAHHSHHRDAASCRCGSSTRSGWSPS